ncbi:MAG: peptide deformylase [Phycisphaerales bacterium]|nr:peptide deformylase [Phycisphaerales bacterium]MCB9836365.1 peptide deformylase [Phycisphaera sp.]
MTVDPEQLRLVLYPDPILREPAQPVGEITPEIRQIAARMIEIMREADGIGLAAPQAGLGLRIFVCDVPPPPEPLEPEDGTQAWTDGPIVCINPEFPESGDARTPFEEGCLSLPGIRGDVVRPEIVRMRATDLEGKPFEIHASGLLARCLQHEADHLDGVLIVDKFTQMSRMKNRTRLRKLKGG